MPLVRKILDISEYILAAVCVVAFATMVALGIATVIFRFVIQSSLAFPDELIRYLFVWLVFLGSAIALRRDAHAAIGVIVDSVPPRLRRVALVAAWLGSALYLVALVVYGISLTRRAAAQISPALEVSMAWVYAAIPVGGAIMLVYLAELVVRQLRAPDAEVVSPGS